MTFTNRQQAELRDLVDALCEDALTAEQAARLESIITSHREACRHYLDYLHFHGILHMDNAGDNLVDVLRLVRQARDEEQAVETGPPAGQGAASDTAPSGRSPILGFLGDSLQQGLDHLSNLPRLPMFLAGALFVFVSVVTVNNMMHKADVDNTAMLVCIPPKYFPPDGIWIYPQFPKDMEAGPEEIKYGWGLFVHLPDASTEDEGGEEVPQGHAVLVDLEEVDETRSPAVSRVLYKDRRVPLEFRRVFQVRPYRHYSFEALPTLVEPFQDKLKRSGDVTYVLSARVVDAKGKEIKSHQIRFVNLPTYLITQAKLEHMGIEPAFGVRSKVNIGDMTGDGECDFLYTIDAKYKAAYDISGRLLWKYEDRSQPKVYNSVATRLYDVDGDGRCEVACLRDGKLCLLDGATGEIKKSTEWPFFSGRSGGLEARIYFANLTGGGVRDILLVNGYAGTKDVRITAYTHDLKLLWDCNDFQEDGTVGMHSLNVADIDGDGKDEVAFGATMLDDDGTLLWRLPYSPLFANGGGDRDHVDEAELGDVDGDGKLEIFYASGTLLDALSGKPYFSKLPGVFDGQWVRILKVRDDLPGKQLVIANKYLPPMLFDIEGKRLEWPFPLAGWDLLDWDGDGKTEIVGGGLVYDRRGRVVGVCEPRWAYTQVCDVTGNGRQEVTPWSLDFHGHGEHIRVFSSAPRPQKRAHKLIVARRHYNHRD
jgi:hypothetical protein